MFWGYKLSPILVKNCKHSPYLVATFFMSVFNLLYKELRKKIMAGLFNNITSITKRASMFERIKNLTRGEQVVWKTTHPDGTITKGGHYWACPEDKFTQKGTELPNYVNQDGTFTGYYYPGSVDLSKFKKTTYLPESQERFYERYYNKNGDLELSTIYDLSGRDNLVAVRDYKINKSFNKQEHPRALSLYKVMLDIMNGYYSS